MIEWLEKHKKLSLVITILLAIEIFYFSSIPGTDIGTGIPFQAIAYHFIVFFLLNFFILTTITRNKIRTGKLLTSITISTIYAILDELHQLFVPMRSARIGDFGIDFLGIILSSLIFLWIKQKSQKE